MKVILQADVKNLGKKGDVVEVAEGYGRNYLLPRGLAVAASAGNLRHAAQQKQLEATKAERELKEAQKVGEKLKDQKVQIKAKVGEAGRLFGSVTPQEIADQLRRHFAVEIDKRKIEIKEPIKSLGTHKVTVKIHPKVHVQVQVDVVAE